MNVVRHSLIMGIMVCVTIACTQTTARSLAIPLPLHVQDLHQGTTIQGNRVITFISTDQASIVLDFYRNHLPSAGWKYQLYDSSEGIVYSSQTIRFGKRHVLNIFVQTTQDGLTKVVINEAFE